MCEDFIPLTYTFFMAWGLRSGKAVLYYIQLPLIAFHQEGSVSNPELLTLDLWWKKWLISGHFVSAMPTNILIFAYQQRSQYHETRITYIHTQ
jgi:hypothetical protein